MNARGNFLQNSINLHSALPTPLTLLLDEDSEEDSTPDDWKRFRRGNVMISSLVLDTFCTRVLELYLSESKESNIVYWNIWVTQNMLARGILPKNVNHATRIYASLRYEYRYVLIEVGGHIIAVHDSQRLQRPAAAKANVDRFKNCLMKVLLVDRPNTYQLVYRGGHEN